LSAQPEDLTQVWPAQWIAPADAPWKSYAMHRFRKTFELDTVPEQLVVHSSGDNRYQLFVNGQQVTYGPQRGDLNHWYYESTNIVPYLRPGKNVLAAQVLNYGSHPPDAQMSVQTGLVLAAGDQSFRFINTGKSWKAIHDPAYAPNLVDDSQVQGYYGGGSREIVDGQKLLWNWASPDYDDHHWPAAQRVESAFAKTCIWASRWKLTQRTLPHERITTQQFQSVRRSEGIAIPDGFPEKAQPVTIPVQTKTTLLFDQGVMTTAYPVLEVSGGEGATIKLEYVEAPSIGPVKARNKGHRGEIEGKQFVGYYDQFTADGNKNRTYVPFWWRAFRYVEMTVETLDEPLIIDDFFSRYSTYPFESKAKFILKGLPKAEQDTLAQILEVGERTVRLCAHESFMDCPYYEESQFEGDTRIQTLISYVLFGDARLGKNAIEQFSWSLNSEGFLSARYPTNSTYHIPNYSLYWIGMLYDYMMYVGDSAFIREKLPVTRVLLNYFLERRRSDGTVRRPDYHNFVDWAFPRGEAPFDEEGYSALVDFHLLLALQWATDLESYAGEAYYQEKYQSATTKLQQAIPTHYWKPGRQLYADTPTGDHYSAHTNHLAILTGMVQGEAAAQLMNRALTDTTLTRPTVYWQFYQFEALQAAGLGKDYLENLNLWKTMLRAGVTTWPETSLRSRSECHAWGASPNYHLYTITAGIRPAAPGFEAVTIAPQLQEGKVLQCEYPHPNGVIRLDLRREDGKLRGTVDLPVGTAGALITEKGPVELNTGNNTL
jgi:hypothetical protein